MIRACSHLVIASENVTRITTFFAECFGQAAYFSNNEFSEFVLPSGFRIAFFKPVGASAKTFSATSPRSASGFGVTVSDVDKFFEHVEKHLGQWGATVSGRPKDHPWGEKSFLLTDCDGNRWEVTQSPSADGMLVNR